MGFFDLFKKKDSKPEVPKQNNLLLSMPMFNSNEKFSLDALINDLKTYWHLDISEVSGNDEVATFDINGESVAVAIMPVPLPKEELEDIYAYNYLWKEASEDLKTMTNHAIVSVLASETDVVERFKIFTKLNASILRTTTNSLGIYKGNQTLLLPKALYLDFADFLKEDMLPIQLWVYIGIVNNEKTNSVYTYGLEAFNKTEIEVIESSLSSNDLYEFLLQILDYVIGSNVFLKDGETIGFSAEQKIKITQSKAIFLEGDSLKLEH